MPPEELLTLLRNKGILLEINRQILHPLGMALAITLEDDGTWTGTSFVHDDDPEGMAYDLDNPEFRQSLQEKAESFQKYFREKTRVREQALGYVVQSLDGEDKE